jgi:hypothetical protein
VLRPNLFDEFRARHEYDSTLAAFTSHHCHDTLGPMSRLGLILVLLAACKKSSPPPAEPANTGGSGVTAPAAAASGACAKLDEAGCRANTACAVISGSPLDPKGCSLPGRVVGCHGSDSACGDALTFAVDPGGKGYWFADTCIPEGWTAKPADPSGNHAPPGACK